MLYTGVEPFIPCIYILLHVSRTYRGFLHSTPQVTFTSLVVNKLESVAKKSRSAPTGKRCQRQVLEYVIEILLILEE